MKNTIAAAAVAAALCGGAAQAAPTDAEFAEMRRQLDSLVQRMDRMEQENAALKARNEQLEQQVARTNAASDTPSAPAAQTAAASTVKTADWPSRIAVKGDLRYRHSQTDDARQSAERDEHLLRARLSVEAKVNDSITGVIGVATSSPTGSFGNPRAGNVQLDGEFSRKPLYLDLGYIDWTFAEDAHAIGGKMKMPFARPGQSLFWDNDINPEGIALTYGRGPWFASGYGFWVEENVQYTTTANPATDTTDTKMFGAQLGRRFDFNGSNLTLAAMYYDLAAAQNRRPFFNNSSNGNTTNGNSMSPSGGLLFDYEVIELMAEYNMQLGELPLQAWIDFAHNRAAILDTAIGAGLMLGKASNPGTWEAGLAFQFIEKDALFAQHIDSDFAGGQSDSDGWVLRAGYAPLKNWALNATYFPTHGNVDIGNEYNHDRLLLDFNVKF